MNHRKIITLTLLAVLAIAALCSGHEHTSANKSQSDKEHHTEGQAEIEEEGQVEVDVEEEGQKEGETEGKKEKEHNEASDHEAFLGKEEAEAFDEFPPEESKKKLGEIYNKIDTDGNGQVTEEELTAWIRSVHNRHQRADTESLWAELVTDNSTELTWKTYAARTFKRTEIPVESPSTSEDTDEQREKRAFRRLMVRDKKRWERADLGSDGSLTIEEFNDFLHPEDVERMKDSVVDETLDHMDKDKDGYISEKEYFEDVMIAADTESPEAEWIKAEREAFHTTRDLNKDGKLDREEVLNWIKPDYDHASAESKHLIQESDDDKDGMLHKVEVISNYKLFVGSGATQYGRDLKQHDEL